MKRVFLVLCCISLCACAPTIAQRLALADRLAGEADMEPFRFRGTLPLAGYRRVDAPGEPVWVFIEGDGLAWVSVTRPSMNPTPLDPVGLRLAAADPAANVIYLARPGQYTGRDVAQRYWLEARFAPEVVEAMNAALRRQLEHVGTRSLYLAGYSGGGALAALLAQEWSGDDRVEVLGLATVAGNLDHRFWTDELNLTPLSGSLNPAARAGALTRLPQRHLVGTADEIVPMGVQQAFIDRLGDNHCARLVTFPLPHDGPWIAPWRESRQRPLACR